MNENIETSQRFFNVKFIGPFDFLLINVFLYETKHKTNIHVIKYYDFFKIKATFEVFAFLISIF